MDEYLQKKNLQIEKPGEDNLLTKAKQVLQEYIEALKTATEAHKRYAETRNKLANDETHHGTLRAILFSVWLMCSRTRKWRTGNGEEPHRYAY